jgi:hypothetical protein
MQTVAFLDYLAEHEATAALGQAVTDVLLRRGVLTTTLVEHDAEHRAAS